jgi:hypothetical protein
MKLTIDNVRALRSLINDFDVPNAGGLAPQQETARALAEEWIARHTVRWYRDDGGSFLRSSVAWFGSVGPYGDRGTWLAETDDGWQLFATEAEARAWLEEQARAAGFEVAT